MAFVSRTPVRQNGHVVPAAIALLLAGFMAPIHLTLFGQSWPLVWLPLVVVALWPRQPTPVLSALVLFAGGLWVDWATLGATGQWALVFAVTFAVLRPDQSEQRRGLLASFLRLLSTLAVAVPILVLSGRFVYGIWPDTAALLRGVVVALILLPVVALARDLFAGRLTREDF